ncbi:MAG TPA: glycine-rich domain-containing protein-like [Coleofasciculaceae cyanobacterium]
MLVVKEALSAQALTCLEKLKGLDLSPIAADLMNSKNCCGWTRQQVVCAIKRYKTFLLINYLYPHILLVPTQDIDRVWHSHILHTRKYRQDCEMLFGDFIDHQPASELSGETGQQNLDAAFVQTQALLALFEGYFETTSEVAEVHEAELAQYQPQQEHLHLYRAACGRPKI